MTISTLPNYRGVLIDIEDELDACMALEHIIEQLTELDEHSELLPVLSEALSTIKEDNWL